MRNWDIISFDNLPACLCEISRERPRGPGIFKEGEEKRIVLLMIGSCYHRLHPLLSNVHTSRNEKLNLSFLIPCSQTFWLELVFKKKNNNTVKACKNILKSIKFEKLPALFVLSPLLSHSPLHPRGRVLAHWMGIFSFIAKLSICHRPGGQCIPAELTQILLCAPSHYHLRSYIKWEPGRFLQLFHKHINI